MSSRSISRWSTSRSSLLLAGVKHALFAAFLRDATQLISDASRNNRKEVIQCLIVYRRGRRHPSRQFHSRQGGADRHRSGSRYPLSHRRSRCSGVSYPTERPVSTLLGWAFGSGQRRGAADSSCQGCTTCRTCNTAYRGGKCQWWSRQYFSYPHKSRRPDRGRSCRRQNSLPRDGRSKSR